jgi:hypothetical protein
VPTQEQDSYVHSVFGVDPAQHADAKQSATGSVTADGGTAPGLDASPPPAASTGAPPTTQAASPQTGSGDAPPAAAEAPPPKQPVITHETEAGSPGNRKRTKLGVGERVTLKVDPGPGKWLVSGGKLSSGSGATVTFIAGDRKGTGSVRVNVGGLEAGVQFDIIEPSEVHQVVVSKEHHAPVPPQPNAGFRAAVYIGPADVSFQFIQIYEQEVNAVTSGYWDAMPDKGHHPATSPATLTGTVKSGLGTKLQLTDHIFSGYPGVTVPPWKGTMVWSIPWEFQVGSGAKKVFATVTQSIVTDDAGTTTATKAGSAPVTFALTDGVSS